MIVRLLKGKGWAVKSNRNCMELHREPEFSDRQMGLGFNLCVAPPQDHGVLILKYGGTEVWR